MTRARVFVLTVAALAAVLALFGFVGWHQFEAGAADRAGAGAVRAAPDQPITAGPPPPRPSPRPKIAVVTAHIRTVDPRGPQRLPVVTYSDKTADMADIAEANMQAYCDWHGYTLRVLRDPIDKDRPLAWSRYLAMLEMFDQGYDWVLYMDADALFANLSVTVEERLTPPPGSGCPAAPEMLVAALHIKHDHEETLNGGVMLVQNTDNVRRLIRQLYDYTPALQEHYQDNAALMQVVRPGAFPFACLLYGEHANWLQSYPHHTQADGTYRPGDWIVHVAGGCAPWCRMVAQLVSVCAMHPRLRECQHAMTLHGWSPMSAYNTDT